MIENNFNIGTFNVRGLSTKAKKSSLKKDIERFNLDVCCIQETKIKKGTDINLDKDRLIYFPSESRHYGNGFYISQKWMNNIYKFWKVNDRVCVLQLRIRPDRGTRKTLTINRERLCTTHITC